MTATLIPASELDTERLAALFTAVYEGYWHPVVVDAPALERMIRIYAIELEASQVALAPDQTEIGLAMLSCRGSDGWLGGMGVLPGHRGAGLGEQLTRAILEAARARGVRRMRLEVLEQNAPAIAIYRRLGFTALRDVAIWSLAAPPSGDDAQGIDPGEALDRLAAVGLDDPWQRSLPTVSAMLEAGTELTAYRARGGLAVCAVADGRAMLLAIDADAATAPALLRAPFADGAETLLWLNGQTEGPVADALLAAGATQLGRQHELQLS